MTIKTLAAAVALTVLPTLALAYECGFDKQASISCADGTKYDAATNQCVAITS
jgi:hypothetical protein